MTSDSNSQGNPVNKHRKFVQVDPLLVGKGRKWGIDMTEWYKTPEGQRRVRACSGIWGAEKDPVVQGQSKVGEYAVATYFHLNPETAVDITIGIADRGGDIRLTYNFSADVKTTATYKLYLLWSQAVNEYYWKKK